MDRNRGDLYVGNGASASNVGSNYNQGQYYNWRPPRSSDGPPRFYNGPFAHDGAERDDAFGHRSPSNYCQGGLPHPFESSPQHSHSGAGGVFRPTGGSGGTRMGFQPLESFEPGFEPNYQSPLPGPVPSLSGHKREFPFSGQGSAYDRNDGAGFAKLFVGSVPRTVTEENIRPLFEEHGNVIEVALIKDKRTGQQQGCCFIKYATSEEADRAIRALHNQHTLPGGPGPIQVRYADGERERFVENKLFVGSLSKQATEKEIEEIFSPYGRIEDVYLMRDDMKQSRGCGFVKFSHKDMALAAIHALNGNFTMRGCNQPLSVRFADPKRPRSGDARSGQSGSAPSVRPRIEAPGPRPPLNVGDHTSPSSWRSGSPQNLASPFLLGIHGAPNQSLPRPGDMAMPLNQAPFVSSSEGTLPGPVISVGPQRHNQNVSQVVPVSQQAAAMSKIPPLSPQHFAPPMNQQGSLASVPTTPFVQGLAASQSRVKLDSSSPSVQQPLLTNTVLPYPASAAANQSQQLAAPPQQQPPQLAQMVSPQPQSLPSSFPPSQKSFSQLQQHLQVMQPQASKPQWPGVGSQVVGSSTHLPVSSSSSASAIVAQAAAPVKCNWTEHTSPEGFKYYYNSLTCESRWEKPEELILFEQQQQVQQKPSVQLHQPQANTQVFSSQQGLPSQQLQAQLPMQIQQQQHQHHHHHHHHQMQQAPFSSGFQNSQEWMWKNKQTGT